VSADHPRGNAGGSVHELTSKVLLRLLRDTPPYMAQALYPLLVNAAWERHVVLSEGIYWSAIACCCYAPCNSS
jgi:hypothetical protein